MNSDYVCILACVCYTIRSYDFNIGEHGCSLAAKENIDLVLGIPFCF